MKESQNSVELTKMNKKREKDDSAFFRNAMGTLLLISLVLGCFAWWKVSSENSVRAQKEERFCNEMGYTQQECTKQLAVLSYLERYEKYGLSIGKVHSDISTREQKEELVKAWQNHESQQSIKQEESMASVLDLIDEIEQKKMMKKIKADRQRIRAELREANE
jgi:hypothetical protein